MNVNVSQDDAQRIGGGGEAVKRRLLGWMSCSQMACKIEKSYLVKVRYGIRRLTSSNFFHLKPSITD